MFSNVSSHWHVEHLLSTDCVSNHVLGPEKTGSWNFCPQRPYILVEGREPRRKLKNQINWKTRQLQLGHYYPNPAWNLFSQKKESGCWRGHWECLLMLMIMSLFASGVTGLVPVSPTNMLSHGYRNCSWPPLLYFPENKEHFEGWVANLKSQPQMLQIQTLVGLQLSCIRHGQL